MDSRNEMDSRNDMKLRSETRSRNDIKMRVEMRSREDMKLSDRMKSWMDMKIGSCMDSRKKRCQSGIEMLILFAVLLIIFIVVLSLSQNIVAGVRYNRELIEATEICSAVTFGIDEVSIAGDGASTQIYLKPMHSGISYQLNIFSSKRLAEITWNNKRYVRYFSHPNVTGNITLIPGNYNLTNGNGSIRIAG